MAYSITIEVDDLTNQTVAMDGGSLQAAIGDMFQVHGVITPAPPACTGCVNILAPNGSIGTVGLGSLGPGAYFYGPTPIPAGSTSFWVKAVYSPTGDSSAIVQVNIVAAPPPPAPPPAAVVVTVHVDNAITKDSVPNASVTGLSGVLVTDASGNVQANVTPGFFNLDVSASGFALGGATINVGSTGGYFTVDLSPLAATQPPPAQPPPSQPPPGAPSPMSTSSSTTLIVVLLSITLIILALFFLRR